MDLNNLTPSTSQQQPGHGKVNEAIKYETVRSRRCSDDLIDEQDQVDGQLLCTTIKKHSTSSNFIDSSTITDDTMDFYGRNNSSCSIITTSGGGSSGKEMTITVPTGLKIISLVSMLTAIILTTASSILLYRSNTVLLAWLKAAPSTLEVLSQINNLFQGNASIVSEVQSQEKYLRTLIYCSAVLIATGIVQLICNLWFFLKMNSTCTAKSLVKTEQFLCGV